MSFHINGDEVLLARFSQQTTLVALEAALLGAKVVVSIYGASPEMLQTEYKADAGISPVTVADWKSQATIIKTIKKH